MTDGIDFLWLALGLLYLAMALLSDALRFASLGILKSNLQKKSLSPERLDQNLRRMESYFDDSGRNLRELEWGMHLSFLGCLIAYVLSLPNQSSLAEIGLEVGGNVLVLSFLGSHLMRAFSEPYAETLLIFLYPLWKAWHLLVWPLTITLEGLQFLVQRVGGVEEEEEEEHEQKLLDSMEDGSKAGLLEESEREMIENLIEFKDLDVAEIMTPRTDMAAVSVEASIDEIVDLMVEHRFSRIIVYKENRDNVVGFVHVRDLLPFWKKSDNLPHVESLLHSVYFVPNTKSIRSLFQEFKTQHLHIAVVLDEYGGTAGLITLEDILEEIVGDIVDEHQDQEEKSFSITSSNEVQAQGKMRVSELEEVFELEFEENDSYDSVGGLIISTLGRIPVTGEQGDLEDVGLSYQITEANERRIETVLFRRCQEPEVS
jgi:CBS domain containing-hemolysin-like protein